MFYLSLAVFLVTLVDLLYNLKNAKNNHGRVLLLVKFQAGFSLQHSFMDFFTFLKFYQWYQIVQSVSIIIG